MKAVEGLAEFGFVIEFGAVGFVEVAFGFCGNGQYGKMIYFVHRFVRTNKFV